MADDKLVMSEEQARVLYEVYMSGFLSGAVSMGLSRGMTPEEAGPFAQMMTTSLEADDEAMKDVTVTINACILDVDIDDSDVIEVRNAFRLP